MKYPHLAAYLAGTIVHFETKEIVSAIVEASNWIDEKSPINASVAQALFFADKELKEIFETPNSSYEAGLENNSVIDVPVMTAEIYRLFYPEPGN